MNHDIAMLESNKMADFAEVKFLLFSTRYCDRCGGPLSWTRYFWWLGLPGRFCTTLCRSLTYPDVGEK